MPPTMPSEEALAAAAAALVGPAPLTGFRLNAAPRREGRFLLDDTPVTIDFAEEPEAKEATEGAVLVSEGGQTWALARFRADAGGAGAAADGAILAPMPGRVIALDVADCDTVTKGQRLLVLEAMKMEHALVAPFDGIVAGLDAAEGAQVVEGHVLARIDRN